MLSIVRKILDLFEPRERWALAGLFGLMVLVALVQTIGVASIMPFMGLVANPGMIIENEWMRRLYDSLGFRSARAFLFSIGLLLLGIMALSNASAAFQQWLILRFAWRMHHRLSVRLLNKYLGEPYTFYLDRNTAGLATNILVEVREFINGVLTWLLKVLAQSFVVVFVFTLLLLVDVSVALAAALILGGAYAAIYSVVRRKQSRLGEVRVTATSLRFKAAAEALGSIKETKVLGRQAEFVRRFAVSDRRYSDANASNAMVGEIPRYALEMVAFGGIIVIVLYLLQKRDDFGGAVAVMSLYALAGYRLMPALQQIFHGLARIRFFLPTLDRLHADLTKRASRLDRDLATADLAHPSITYERTIVLDGISYIYPSGEANVLRNINLEIPRNTSVALVGSTGCGKTTLVDILLGLLEAHEGSIRVDDVTLSPGNIALWQKRVGYVPQHIYLCDDSVTRNVAFGLAEDEIDHAAVERAARIAHLHDFIVSLPDGYNAVVGEHGVRLSGGQRQRIGIARALYHDPDVLIMDEATSALDGITEDAVITAIRDLSRQKTIVLVAHRLTTVQECDRIYLLDRGEIVASGGFHELMRTNPKFRAMARGGLEEAAVP
jgi:ABC-type multidrug transport system fused ATPase/permease subunit